MKRAAIDASSAIILYKAGLFSRLTKTYRIRMAGSVYKEITRAGYAGARNFENAYRSRHFSVFAPAESGDGDANFPAPPKSMGRGEWETIVAYLNGAADFVIIDDRTGNRYCRSQGIPYINALLFPRLLHLAQAATAARTAEKTAAIIRIGRYSPEIIQYARHATLAEMAAFIP